MIDRKLRIDALPEFHRYQDEGCDVSPLCTACPLPACRYEVHGGLRELLNIPRNARIREMRAEGLKVVFIAAEIGVSPRTAWRVLEA